MGWTLLCLVLVIALPATTHEGWTLLAVPLLAAFGWAAGDLVERHRAERSMRSRVRSAVDELEEWLRSGSYVAVPVLAHEYCPVCGVPTDPASGRCVRHGR